MGIDLIVGYVGNLQYDICNIIISYIHIESLMLADRRYGKLVIYFSGLHFCVGFRHLKFLIGNRSMINSEGTNKYLDIIDCYRIGDG